MCVLFALALVGLDGDPPRAEEGTFIHLSDIHFDPFEPVLLANTLAASDTEAWQAKFAGVTDQPLARFGEDTNHALLASALAALGRYGASADFAILTGDLLVHDFEARAEAALGTAPTSEATRAFAVRTTIFVADGLRAALPGKPIIVSLGNNDSSCGDYHIDPGGGYLAATRETVRRLVGADLVAADFDETYAAGGYYALRHPTVPGVVIIVLDDVLWSERYVNSCGTSEAGMAAATGMMAWLEKQLAGARANGGHVWLAHHIPVGIDAFATAKSKAATCPAKLVPYLKEPFGSGYLKLLVDYADVVQASFTGHIHFDDYRLIGGGGAPALDVEKIAPGISPIFGQNPGFHVFTYDRTTGAPTDFATYYLANLATAPSPAAADWRREYGFAETYRQPGYSAKTVAAVSAELASDAVVAEIYERLYDVSRDDMSHGEFDAATFPAYRCAVAHPDPRSFTTCYCGG